VERRDVISHTVWRALLGKVEAHERRPDVGEALVDEAVEWVLRSDQLERAGNRFFSQAEVRELVGDEVGAVVICSLHWSRSDVSETVPQYGPSNIVSPP
jgi:hypothetical protein